MSNQLAKSGKAQAVASAEGDPALRLAVIGFLGLLLIAASAFAAFPSLGAVFLDSYKQQYQSKVAEALACRFP